MSFGDATENAILALIFNATTWNNIAENDTTSPATDLEVALHTADPGEGGTQLTSEATYTGYARQLVVRTSSGWTVSGNAVNPAADIDFPEATGGTETLTHASVGVSGDDVIIASGAISPNISVSSGTIPRVKSTSSFTLD